MKRQSSLVLCSIGASILPLVGSCRSHARATEESTAGTDTRHPSRSTPAPPDTATAAAATLARANVEMRRVLDELATLGGQPIELLGATEARRQPSVADAVRSLIEKGELDAPPADELTVEDRTITGLGGSIPVRLYRPPGDGPLPVIVYFHGGGWVIADLDTYDASARALCIGTQAVVVSSHYRQAPESKFPAAHDDAFAAYRWTLENAAAFGGDPAKVAVAGESAGGNMAAAVCVMARDAGIATPVHELLVYPVTSTSLAWPSVEEFALAKPLNKEMLPWFLERYAPSDSARRDPRLDLMAADLRDLPPATVIVAEIDPLRSEAIAFAERLERVGVPVAVKEYQGVTHEFFGLAPAVAEAREAQQFACERLRQAFEGAGLVGAIR